METTATIEPHLGGYMHDGDPATTFPTMWKFLVNDKKIKSVLDVGCGRGHALKIFQDQGCRILGIEGCRDAVETSIVPGRVKCFDFTYQKVVPQKDFDLVISVEFVEHVEEKYKENFLACFDKGKYIAMTFAGPGQGGHHHVNCQPAEYWIEEIEKRGFMYNEKYTKILKDKALEDRFTYCPTFDGNHFEHRGLFFEKNEN